MDPWAKDCQSGRDLHCGSTLHVAQHGNNSLNASNYDISNCDHASYNYNGVDHVFYIDAGYHGSNLTIQMTGLWADMDMFLFRSCSDIGGTRFYDCVGTSTKAGVNSETINVYNASGRYILVVDGFTAGVSSAFDLTVSCGGSGGGGASCAATSLYCGESRWVNAPSQNNMNRNTYDFSYCNWNNNYNSYDGKDHLYKIDVGYQPTTLEIDLSGFSYDMDMFLFQTCGSGYSGKLKDCVGSANRSGTYPEKIIVYQAVGTYYLAVESVDPWYVSGYEIDVKCTDHQTSICHLAQPLLCGENKWVNAPHENNMDHNHYDYSSCYGGYHSYEGKDHLYQINAGVTGKDMTIRLSNFSVDYDLILYKWCSDHYGNSNLTECVGYSRSNNYGYEEITIHGATGTYYLAVDTNDPWNSSGYELSLTCHEPIVDPCHSAIHLSCGDSKWMDAPTYNNYDHRSYDYDDCHYGNSHYSGKDHIFIVDAGYTGRDLKVTVSNLSADMDVMVFRSCGYHYGKVLRGCVGYSNNPGYNDEEVIIHGAQGKYYVVVDADNDWYNSGFKIKVDCLYESGTTCDRIESIYCGDDIWESAPTSNHYSGNDYLWGGCNTDGDNYEGKERVYKLEIPYDETKDIKIELTNLTDNMDLFVFTTCSENYQDPRLGGCEGASTKYGTSSEKVEIFNASGDYFIVVDSKNWSYASGYKLKVHCMNDDDPGDDPGDDPSDDPTDDPGDDPSDDPVDEGEPMELICGTTIYSSTVDASNDFDQDDIQDCLDTDLLYSMRERR